MALSTTARRSPDSASGDQVAARGVLKNDYTASGNSAGISPAMRGTASSGYKLIRIGRRCERADPSGKFYDEILAATHYAARALTFALPLAWAAIRAAAVDRARALRRKGGVRRTGGCYHAAGRHTSGRAPAPPVLTLLSVMSRIAALRIAVDRARWNRSISTA